MCGSMADIRSPTAEIRRGKKKERTNDSDENIYGLPYYIGQTIKNQLISTKDLVRDGGT